MMFRKALVMWQPYAWLLFHGKPIENRPWNTSYRGQFWVLAGTEKDQAYYDEALAFARGEGYLGQVPSLDELDYGGVIGHARIARVIPPRIFRSGQTTMEPELPVQWHMPKQYGFQLTDATTVPFVPAKGRQRWFYLNDEVMKQLEAHHETK